MHEHKKHVSPLGLALNISGIKDSTTHSSLQTIYNNQTDKSLDGRNDDRSWSHLDRPNVDQIEIVAYRTPTRAITPNPVIKHQLKDVRTPASNNPMYILYQS